MNARCRHLTTARAAIGGIGVWLLAEGVAAGQNLRDLARQQGGRATTTYNAELPVIQVPELLADSDLVLRGYVAGVRPRLNLDESIVVTEYAVVPLQIFKQRRPLTLAKPDQAHPILVWVPGGELTEGGLQMSTKSNIQTDAEALKAGEDVILFLFYRPDMRVYVLTDGPFSAFRIQERVVTPLTEEVVKRRGDRPVDIATFMNALAYRPR